MAAWVKGAATDAYAAIAAAAALLADARMPVFAGLNADVAAIRAAYRLAARLGGSLDTLGGAGTYAELAALAHGGAMTTTPAEVVGRADAVLAVGARAADSDLAARLRASRPVRGRTAGAERHVLALEGGDLAARLAHLRAHARGHLADDAELHAIARTLATAGYGAVLYAPEEVGAPGVAMLQGLVRDLNAATRCFGLALGGPDQDRAVVQVSAWTTGQAPRTGFGRHLPEHDPWRFEAARQVASAEADAALWLSPLPAPAPDWLARLPAIAIVGEDGAAPDAAEIVIAVAVPGAGAGGVLWNEGRAALTYHPGGDAPSAAAILARIERETIGRRDAAC